MNTEMSLFSLLHKWAWRQDENFVTEAFAYLLRYMAHTRSSAISEILEKLTDWYRHNLNQEHRSGHTLLVLTGRANLDAEVAVRIAGRVMP